MTAEPFLNAIAGLFGDQPVGGLTMASAARSLTSPPLPAGWDSAAAQGL
ncbi:MULTISPECIES: hypothetical protein [Mycobacterium]|nr:MULTISPECIES: hypothetical protein [Mycobacterium]